jgi:hypothetical protein
MFSSPSPYPSPPGDYVEITKKLGPKKPEETVGWKSLKADTFSSEILAFHILEMTLFSTNIDEPFLKDRILRLWNLTVSSTRVAIKTESPGGRGEVRGAVSLLSRKK